jgi:LPXTG-motif cell wall-anchored protein
MLLRSKLATWQVLAVTVITLGIFGPLALYAKDKEGCQQKACHQECHQACPAPVLCKPAVSAPCCPAPVCQKPCAPPPAPSCCPVDPKDVRRAERANEHAQHEAAEACKRQQRAAEKAQARIDKAYERGNQRIDDATAKVNQRYSEWQDEYAKLNSVNAGAECCVTPSEPAPEPTPEPAPAPEVAPPPVVVIPAPEVTPAPAPIPEPPQETPKELPKTASSLDLLGLIGLLSTSGSYLIGFFRRQS